MKWISKPRGLLIGAVLAALALGGAWRAGYLGGAPAGSAAGDDRDASASARGDREGGGRGGGAIPVSVTAARIQDVPVTLDAVGTVQAYNTATIQTQVDGRLTSLPFKEGDDVKKGDIVATIEPYLYQAAYDQTVAKKAQDEANLANARIDLGRYQKLAASNYGSQQQYTTQKYLVAQLEAQVKTDQALIDSAKTTLDYCVIRSPIDGRAGIRAVDVGNILHASAQSGTGQILTITQIKPIYVFYTIPQQSLPAVRRAQAGGNSKVSALAPDNSTVIETGEVSVIDNQIDQTTGTARIKATFANPALRLWPGEFVNVRMVVDTIKNAIVVPSTAVQRGPSGAYVYVLGEGDVAKLANVTTGFQDDNANMAVVSQGLHAGDTVIATGFGRLSDGAMVRVVTPTANGADQTAGSPPPAAPGSDALGERRRRRDGRNAGAPRADAPAKRPDP